LALVWLGLAACAAAAPAPRPAPEFTIHLISGRDIHLSSYRGKVVVLLMVSTDCPHCQSTARFLESLVKRLGPRGYQPLAAAFNQNAHMLVQSFIDKARVTFPVGYADRSSVLAFLGRSPKVVTYVPVAVFIDRRGMIRGQYTGDDPFLGPDDDVRDRNILMLVEQLLREDASSPPKK
jgi:peroxiredoxin